MCGIAGIVHWDGRPIESHILKNMADTLVHRGPDEEGFYFNRCATESTPTSANISGQQLKEVKRPLVGLAHRRLSIIDLSTGQQPLCNEDGTIWIVFNGEIYNFQEIRGILESRGHQFKTGSDTEVIVHAYEEWNTECLSHLNGMFAFAIWNEIEQSLFLGRDRIGKKPLYYHANNNTFFFGSELKALLAYPGIQADLDLTAVTDYFKYLYVPDPKTIFSNFRKLPPAHYLLAKGGSITIVQYWDVRFDEAPIASELVLEDQLFSLLEQTVHDRMVAEVPLGAFLSGGVDSSGIVALMTRQSQKPVLTCSIGFDDPVHDESRYAAQVAQYLGTSHHEFIVRDNFLDMVRRLPALFDEPFADASALPTYYVCKMARQQVTVALSGDGGDETFAGYDKYTKDIIERIVGHYLPNTVLRMMNKMCNGNSIYQQKARTLTAQALRSPARSFYETNTVISGVELENLLSPEIFNKIKDYDPFEYIMRFFNTLNTDDHLTRMLYTDIKTSLPGDILVKVDRTSMANSLEVRAPLLDYRVVEFAASLPSRLKIRRGNKKYLLKKVFGRVLPGEIFRRPKHGFTAPLDRWFRNELILLAEEAFFFTPEIRELLNVEYIRRLWNEHRSGQTNRGLLLWSILMFALWYRDVHRGSRILTMAT